MNVSLTPAAMWGVHQLQRSAGNRAVTTLIGASPIRVGAPLVQRQPTAGVYGLDKPANEGTYVDKAVALWKTDKKMKLDTFASKVLNEVVAELTSEGVPKVNVKLDRKLGAAGEFDSQHWLLRVNVGEFGSNAKVVGDLSEDQAANAVGTIYHEARHADQDVLIIRSLLDRNKSVAAIVSETHIDKGVVEQVRKTKYRDPLDALEVEHASRMFDVMYGKHNQLLKFIMDNLPMLRALGGLQGEAHDLVVLRRHAPALSTWQSGTLQPAIAKLKSAKQLTTVETGILADLVGIDATLNAMLKAFQVASKPKRPVAADLEALISAAAAFFAELDKDQRHLEGEKDAYRVEAEIQAAFKTKATTKS